MLCVMGRSASINLLPGQFFSTLTNIKYFDSNSQIFQSVGSVNQSQGAERHRPITVHKCVSKLNMKLIIHVKKYV